MEHGQASRNLAITVMVTNLTFDLVLIHRIGGTGDGDGPDAGRSFMCNVLSCVNASDVHSDES